MKKIILSGAFIFLILSCASNETSAVDELTQQDSPEITQQQVAKVSADVSADEFKKLLTEKPGQLIDVRTPQEFASGSIEGAENIDFYSADFSEQLDKLDKTKPVYVYCKSGGRSGQAKAMLTEKGFTTVYNLIGGYSNWKF